MDLTRISHVRNWGLRVLIAPSLLAAASLAHLPLALPVEASLADAIEVDSFENVTATIELALPGGSVEVVSLIGTAIAHVFFEGTEGQADDDDMDGRDEVSTELVSLYLRGYSAVLGPVQMSLNQGIDSSGEMEERVNGTAGTLDVAPFSSGGLVDSFFDIYFGLEIGGVELHNVTPQRLSGVISHKPAALGESYESITSIQLMNANGEPTEVFIGATRVVPNPLIEVDTFENTATTIELILPTGGSEVIFLTGPSTTHVFFEGSVEGGAGDHDGNGRDDVATELVSLDLRGYSLMLGPVQLSLNTEIPSLGEMEEQGNSTSGTLDVAPFSAGGLVDSFLDVFFVLTYGGGTELHNGVPQRLTAALAHKPPAYGEAYESAEDIELLSATGQSTGLFVGATEHVPNPLIEVDEFANTATTIELILPTGGSEVIFLTGPSTTHVFFEGSVEGGAGDDDGDRLDEVATELVSLDLRGTSAAMGPVRLSLNTELPSLGEMEEQVDSTPGTLDVAPFTGGGLVDSFFDLFFVLDIDGAPFHNESLERLYGEISHKPPAAGEAYENLEQVELYDAEGQATGIFIGAIEDFDFVPEPQSGWMIAAALSTLALLHRRRRTSSRIEIES
jgi:hypothetical protein